MVKLFFIFICILISSFSTGQNITDSLKPNLLPKKVIDTVNKAVVKDSVPVTAKPIKLAYLYNEVLQKNVYFNFFTKSKKQAIQLKRSAAKEDVFYLLSGLLLFFGLLKMVFEKYFQNLFKILFRVSLKQKQLREQLSQTPLPSLLMNVFFILVASLFCVFILRNNNFFAQISFWYLFGYSVIILTLVYAGKFLILKLTGWAFGLSAATDTYIFIVFMVNKFLSISLLPLLILIAFANASTTAVWITVAYVFIFICFMYRYISSYSPIRHEIKVNQLHFFLYLCAIELAPLLLIYKVLINFLDRTI
jgi:Domain of unknown function (DUF4271)